MGAPRIRSLVSAFALIFLFAQNASANSATWSANPVSNQWVNSDNWSLGGPPNGANDIATFGSSNITSIFGIITDNQGHFFPIELSEIIFESGASAYTLSGSYRIGGIGITNNSGIVQHLEGAQFINHATAGTNLTALDAFCTFRDFSSADHAIITNNPATMPFGSGSVTYFTNFSTADHAMITNNAGTIAGAGPGTAQFRDHSTAGHAIIVNNGATAEHSGETTFSDDSSADHATIVANGATIYELGANIDFSENASADAATLIANGGSNDGLGGTIHFSNNTTGGTSRIELWGNATLDIVHHNPASGLAIGSLEGTGTVLLGQNTLSVGNNNANTSFSGSIQDQINPVMGVHGSLTKIGTGTLILSGANTYSGSTTVEAGQLIVNGSLATAVTVSGGTLGGSGIVGGIIVNAGAALAPGNSAGILHAHGNLQLSLGATYLVDLNGSAVGTEYDQTDVSGSVSLGDATLSLNLGFAPKIGTTFTIINNDLSDLVAGMFAGLPEGAVFSDDGQTFTITYHGGDGNDVVIAAVPEPQTWILSIATLIGLFMTRRRLLARNPG